MQGIPDFSALIYFAFLFDIYFSFEDLRLSNLFFQAPSANILSEFECYFKFISIWPKAFRVSFVL